MQIVFRLQQEIGEANIPKAQKDISKSKYISNVNKAERLRKR